MNQPATRLATALADRYRVERELGRGGMATVYLAEDLKHDRKVAIKVLKSELAAVLGAERFVVEIKTTAAMSHPHILPLFDSGTADGFLFYVMPYIEGETIREKLNRETQFGVDEAVRITREVADALDYAHRHGVIHRDIKPENILLHDGRAMVMDFGIALAVSAAAGGRVTETGLSLGTPHYMSPEQATAEKEITPRSDIYSLASVLYEMLSGQPPHVGGAAQQVIMRIIADTARPVHELRKNVPANVDAALARALEKLPADRFENAKAFADALADAHFTAGAPASGGATRASVHRVPLAAMIMVVVAAATGWLARGWTTRAVPPSPIQFGARIGRPGDGSMPFIEFAPDGRRIVQTFRDSTGTRRLQMLDLGSNTVTQVAGTEGATDGAGFSPDGEWIAFVADGVLKKISVHGGPATIVVDSLSASLGSIAWSGSGDLIFSGRGTGLWRVPAAGGAAVQLTRLDTARNEFAHWSPQLLPGERAVIYTSYATPVAKSRIEAYDFRSGRTTILAEGAVFGRHAPSGHLLYARDGAVFAIAFDPDRLLTRGTAVPVQEDVAWNSSNAVAGYAVSPTGTFAYIRDSEWGDDRALVWRDRAGRDVRAIERVGRYTEPRLSPDGRWIALTAATPKPDVWLYDVGRRALTQLTHAPSFAFNAVWMADSRRIAYSFEDRVFELHVVPIDASTPDRVLMTSPYDKFVSSVFPDGRHMLFTEMRRHRQVNQASVDGGDRPQTIAASVRDVEMGVVSPDGRWIAFAERGGDVYLQSVGGNGGRRAVSVGGGTQPRWTMGGREIVYVGPAAMMSVAVNPLTGVVAVPVPLFRTADLATDPEAYTHSYDVTSDGLRFLVLKRVERPASQPLVVVLNWRPTLGQSKKGSK